MTKTTSRDGLLHDSKKSVSVHVTRIAGTDVFGHETSYCDESGCSGDELFWAGIPSDGIVPGDRVVVDYA